MPCPDGLDMCGIHPTRGGVQPKLLTMLGEPLPNHVACGNAVASCKIDGTAMAISSGCNTSTMKRIANLCLETDSKALSVVITICAQDCPIDAGRIHRLPKMKEKLPKIRIHAADD